MSKVQDKKSSVAGSDVDIMTRLLAGLKVPKLHRGEEIDATITSISRRGVSFDLGSKAKAILGSRETRDLVTYLPYLKVGDSVRVKLISEESKDGYPVVSLRKFFERGKWEILLKKCESEEDIEVICGDYGKGGVFVDFMGIRGVIPKIQLAPGSVGDPTKLSGNKIKVRVIEVDPAKNRLVVSQKASVLNISQKAIREKFADIKVNGRYEAKVLSTSEFGIFCEVKGVEGLIHISEVSWEKVTDVSQLYKPGDKLQVVVVEKNDVDLKLNLSLKRLTDDPWKDIEERYAKDKEVTGEVVRKESYGYFVRFEPGVEGLIHVSKLTNNEELKIGDKITVFVERVSRRDRKLSLVLPRTDKPILYR